MIAGIMAEIIVHCFKVVDIQQRYTNIDGIGLNSNFLLGDLSLSTSLIYGNWDDSRAVFALKDIISLSGLLSGDWWNLFAGYLTTELENESSGALIDAVAAPFFAVLAPSATAEQIAEVSQSYLYAHGNNAYYWFSGFNIDYNNFLFDFEYASYVIEDSVDSKNKVWYAALGYRFNNVTLMLHHEDFDDTFEAVNLSDPNLTNATNFTRRLFDAFPTSARVFDGNGITLRYDFHPNAALKIDYFSGEQNFESFNPAGFNFVQTDNDFSIWSIGVDLVF